MKKKQSQSTKYISIIYRLGNRFFDRELACHHIGCGQQFFLRRIFENQGISMYDLAGMGHFDKATVTKAIRKLEKCGYIRIEPDMSDKRIKRLYAEEAAHSVLEDIYNKKEKWSLILTKGMSEEEVEHLESLLEKMAGNASKFILSKEFDKNE